MILYHGSYKMIDRVCLAESRPHKDFGRGFYLTTFRSHAMDMARKKAERNGGLPVVTAFQLCDGWDSTGLKVLVFDKETTDWVKFVYSNREVRDYTHDYDIVVGPVADDGLRSKMFLLKRGVTTPEEILKEITFKERTVQYCFCTEMSLKYLKLL